MNILYTASEALPFIASGGLADVAGSLPAAINAEGHDCRVVIPFYSSIRQELKDKLTYVTGVHCAGDMEKSILRRFYRRCERSDLLSFG